MIRLLSVCLFITLAAFVLGCATPGGTTAGQEQRFTCEVPVLTATNPAWKTSLKIIVTKTDVGFNLLISTPAFGTGIPAIDIVQAGKIEFSSDGGRTYGMVIAASPNNAGNFQTQAGSIEFVKEIDRPGARGVSVSLMVLSTFESMTIKITGKKGNVIARMNPADLQSFKTFHARFGGQ